MLPNLRPSRANHGESIADEPLRTRLPTPHPLKGAFSFKKDIYSCVGACAWMRACLHEGWAIGAGMNLAPTGLEPYPPLSPSMHTR